MNFSALNPLSSSSLYLCKCVSLWTRSHVQHVCVCVCVGLCVHVLVRATSGNNRAVGAVTFPFPHAFQCVLKQTLNSPTVNYRKATWAADWAIWTFSSRLWHTCTPRSHPFLQMQFYPMRWQNTVLQSLCVIVKQLQVVLKWEEVCVFCVCVCVGVVVSSYFM